MISALHVGSPVLGRGFPATTSALPTSSGRSPGAAFLSLTGDRFGDGFGDRRLGGDLDLLGVRLRSGDLRGGDLLGGDLR